MNRYAILVINPTMGRSGIEPPDIVIDICSSRERAILTVDMIKEGRIDCEDIIDCLGGADREEFTHYFPGSIEWDPANGKPEFEVISWAPPEVDVLIHVGWTRKRGWTRKNRGRNK